MKLKYSPCKWNPYASSQFPEGTNPDTEIEIVNENAISVDDELFEFDELSIAFPDVYIQTNGIIQEAHRTNGELFITVRRFYTQTCDWDTGDYQ